MLTRIGDIDQGDIAPDDGFAIRRTSTAPVLNAGQNISFDILVRNGVYVESDFNIVAIPVGAAIAVAAVLLIRPHW